MRLDDFDIEVCVQCCRDFLGQFHKQVHAQRHVSRPHDYRVTRCSVDCLQVVVRQSGGADHMHRACLGCQPCESDRGSGSGKIDDGLGFCEGLQRVVGDGDPDCGAAHGFTYIAPDPRVPRPFQHANKGTMVRRRDLIDQHLPHPARAASDYDTGYVCHGVSPACAFAAV